MGGNNLFFVCGGGGVGGGVSYKISVNQRETGNKKDNFFG